MSDSPAEMWSEAFKVHSYEVDFEGRATLETLCHYFQEAAWNHAERLGVGYSHLQREQRLWVLSRLLIKIDRYPLWGDTITVRTWPRRARSAFALRDFRILDASGTILAAGSSAWLVLDAATRKPLRADKMLAHFTELSEERALERDPEKLASVPKDEAGGPAQVTANYSDIDVNGHANYAWYIACALNSRPVHLHAQYAPAWLEANYLGETNGSDAIFLATSEAGPEECLYSIFKSNTAEELCRLKITWRRRERTA